MTTTNISLLRKNLFTTFDNVIQFNQPVVVNTKRGNAVIISLEEYNAMIETIYLSSQPGLLEKIKEGEKEDRKTMTTYNPNEDW